MKNLEYYLSLKYPIELVETDEGFIVSHPDLPGCHSFGDTLQDAIQNLGEVRALWLEGQYRNYGLAPEPRDDEDYSGKFVLRVPKWLHRALEKVATRDKTSLNQLAVSLLSRGVGAKGCEANSKELYRICERLEDQFAAVCGMAPTFYVHDFAVSDPPGYSMLAFERTVPSGRQTSKGSKTILGLVNADDEEVLDSVWGRRFSNKFASKIQTTGKRI